MRRAYDFVLVFAPRALFAAGGVGMLIALFFSDNTIRTTSIITAAAAFVLATLMQQQIARQILRASEARFRALNALGSDWYWEADAEYRLTHVSEGLARLTGRSISEFLGRVRWQNEFVSAAGGSWAAHKSAVSRRLPFRDLVLRYVSPQGLVVYGSISGEPMFDDAGELQGFRGVGKDVTAEVVLRQRLRMQHDVTRILGRASDTLHAIRAVIETICRTMEWQWGAHRLIDNTSSTLNCGAYWLLPGFGAKAFAEHALAPITINASHGPLGRTIARAEVTWFTDRSTESFQRSALAREAGLRGAVFVPVPRNTMVADVLEFFTTRVEVPDQVLQDTLEAIGREVGQFIDHREAQQASNTLERERRHLHDLLELQLEHMPVPCMLQDERFRVVYCNSAAERIFGYTQEELHGTDVAELIVPDDGQAAVAARRVRLHDGDRGIVATVENRNKDGTRVMCEWKYMPLYDEAGRFSGVLATAQDVTERMQMMAALEESEARFRAMFEQASVGIAIRELAEHPRFLRVNRKLCEILGYAENELLGMTTTALTAGEDMESTLQLNRKLMGDELSHYSRRKRYRRKDGRIIWVNLSVSRLDESMEGHQVRYLLSVVQDITEQVESESRMIESEARYRQIFKLTPLPMYLRDEDTLQFIDVNKACQELYGYTSEEMLEMSLIDIQTSDGRDRYLEGLSTRQAGVVERLQKQHMRRGGELIDVEIHSYPTLMAGRRVRLVLVRDMTEQIAMERLLRDKEARLRAIADHVPAVIAFFDSVQTLQYSNLAFDRWFGSAGGDGPVWSPGNGLQPLLERALRGEEITTESTLDTLSGQRVVRLTLVPHRDDDGLSEGAYFMGYDLTDFRRAEAEVQNLNAELEQRVEQRTHALAAANRELESFSYSVSHDLRAPLRTIDGFSQILIDEYAGVLNEAGRGYLERVRAGSQRMAQLIDDLLELARVTRRDLKIRRCDLSAMARDIVRELHGVVPTRTVRVTVADGMQAMADEGLLRIALDNLLRNAWKFTGLVAEATIEVGDCLETGGERTFFVRDNGVGFDMAYVEKLFGAFQRLHSEAEFQGTGIGLALVQRVIRRHGGQVWAEAETGRGATFYFSMPAMASVNEPAARVRAKS